MHGFGVPNNREPILDRTQRTATFAGLALVVASLVGAVVVSQGSGDVMLGNAPTVTNRSHGG